MVVSTERPPDTAASEAPAPRWAVTRRSCSTGRPSSSAGPAAGPRRGSGRGTRSGGVATGAATPPGRRTSRPRGAWWRGTQCRSRRPGAAGAELGQRTHRRQGRGVVQRGQLGQLSEAALGCRVEEHRPGEASPPWTTRWPAASTAGCCEEGRQLGPQSSPRRSRHVDATPRARRAVQYRSFRLLEPTLTTEYAHPPTLPDRATTLSARPHRPLAGSVPMRPGTMTTRPPPVRSAPAPRTGGSWTPTSGPPTTWPSARST